MRLYRGIVLGLLREILGVQTVAHVGIKYILGLKGFPLFLL